MLLKKYTNIYIIYTDIRKNYKLHDILVYNKYFSIMYRMHSNTSQLANNNQ